MTTGSPASNAASCGGDTRAARWREDKLARCLAAAYVLYGLVAVAFLAMNLPPFQNPDEPAHFLRAAQVADGRLVGFRIAATSGGFSDPALLKAYEPFSDLGFHPETRTVRADWEPRIRWSNARAPQSFPTTAINPPLFYIPAALGVLVGRAGKMTVLQTLVLSRLLTGVAALAVGAVAIAGATGVAPLTFALLTLPMSLAMTASASQDSMILAVAALAGSLLVRASRRRDERTPRLVTGLAIALGLLAMARLPYAVLALLPLALTGVRMKSRIGASALVVVIAAVWSGIATIWAMTNFGEQVGADPAAQLALLESAPFVVLTIARETLSNLGMVYVQGFIGRLGWSDTIFSSAYYRAALAVLVIAAAAAALGSCGERMSIRARLLIVAALSISIAGVFGATYLCWTVPGALVVTGVQGRYFLPLALACVALVPAFGRPRWSRTHQAMVAVVLAFPVITLATVMRGVVVRYYLD